jgi:hypothetical protein
VLRVILSDNCTIIPDTFTVKLKVLPALKVSTTVIDSLCYPGKAVFKSVASGGRGKYTYTWFDPSYIFQGDKDSLVLGYTLAIQAGNHKRICVLSDGCSQPDTAKATVWLNPRPIAYFELSPEKISLSYPILQLHNKSKFSNRFIWDIPKLGKYTEREPPITFKDTGDHLISLIAISSEGCRDTFNRSIFVHEPCVCAQ